MSTSPSRSEHHNGQDMEARMAALEARLAALEAVRPEDRVSIIVFSGELDKVLAAFVIATGAASMGQKVSMFFTFWGLNALRAKKVISGKPLMEQMMAVMSPASTKMLGTSKMNFFGAGSLMLRRMMKEKNVASLEELIQLARELGVRIVACEMSREVMGIREEELCSEIESGGVASFLADALKSKATLFI